MDEPLLLDWLRRMDQAAGALIPVAARAPAGPAAEFLLPTGETEPPEQAWDESTVWAERYFRPDASPFCPANSARHSVHLATPETFDLLRHEYRFQAFDLVATDTMSFTCVRVQWPGVDLLRLTDWQPVLRLLALNLFRAEPGGLAWAFECPDALVEGGAVSTNPAADIYFLPHWSARADAVIHQASLYLFCYKKEGESQTLPLPGEWFPEKYRAKFAAPPEAARPEGTGRAEEAPPAEPRCQRCGAAIRRRQRYCSECGTHLEDGGVTGR